MTATIGDRAWQVPQDKFIAIWKSAATLDEVTSAICALVGRPVPRWAVMARAADLRRDGVELKPFITRRPTSS